MTLSVRYSLLALAAIAAAPSLSRAQAAIPSVAEQIAAAVLPLPADMRADAAVMGYRSKDKLELLKPGKNGMICLALYVTRPDFHVACYHTGLEAFMARGRELRAQGITKHADVDSVRYAEIKSGKLRMPAQGSLYSLTGKKEQFDAASNTVTGIAPLGVIYIPGATAASIGISDKPTANGPWLMSPGTPKAHVMLIGKM